MLSLDRLTTDCMLRTKQTFVQGTHSGGGFQQEQVNFITLLLSHRDEKDCKQSLNDFRIMLIFILIYET